MQTRALATMVASTRARRVAILVVLVAVVLAWWWYPTFANDSAETDVAIAGDSFLRSAEREVTYRIHEDGFSLTWAESPPGTETSWCDLPATVQSLVDAADPDIVVVSAATEGTCGIAPVELRAAVRDAAGSAKLIVVVAPAAEDLPVPDGAVVVRPSRLIGADGTLQQGCLWFDTCLPDGRVDVRNADGTLAPSGQTRVARMIVTALR